MSKIQELKNQCYYEVQEGRNAFETYTVTRFDTEKFAKLVAQECIGILEHRNEYPVVVNSIKEIKEHFGVE